MDSESIRGRRDSPAPSAIDHKYPAAQHLSALVVLEPALGICQEFSAALPGEVPTQTHNQLSRTMFRLIDTHQVKSIVKHALNVCGESTHQVRPDRGTAGLIGGLYA